jgi:DNA modification methylase
MGAAKRCGGTVSLAILRGDALEMLRTLPEQSVNACVTSPPFFGLRDYGMAGCVVGGTVLDPFFGSGTTGLVSLELGCIGIELNPEYVQIARRRCNVTPGLPL